MKRYAGFIIVSALLACVLIVTGCEQKPKTVSSSSPAINMQDGLWEITTTVEMAGVPAGMIKPQTFTTCLNKTDYVPKAKAETDCTMKDVKTEGNTVSWTVVCKDSTSKGRITYAGATYDGTTETTMKQDGKDMTVKTNMKGKHIGPCTK
jgi:hypothetical protein